MSEQEKLDDIFKNAFDSYAPPVPSGMWDRIASERDKRKPIGFWSGRNTLIIAGILVCVLAAGARMLYRSQSATSAANDAATNQGSGKASNYETPTDYKDKASADQVISNNTSNTNALTAEKSVANDATAGNGPGKAGDQQSAGGASYKATAALVPANNTSNTNSLTTKTPSGKAGTTHAAIENRSTAMTGAMTTSNQHLNTTRTTASANAGTSDADLTEATISTNPSGSVANSQRRPNTRRGRSNRIQTNGDATNTATAHSTDVAVEDLIGTETSQQEHMLFNPEKLVALLVFHPVEMKITPRKDPGCPGENDVAGNRSYWDLYAGPDYATKTYSDTAGSVLLQRRRESMSFQSAFSIGARYTRVFASGMSFRAGVNYSQVVEKFSFLQSNVVQLNYEIDPVTGDTTGTYYTRGTRYRNSYNTYRTLDIPITMGYEMGNSRFHANINAGPVINIRSWQNGETLDTNYQPVKFSSNDNNSLYQYKSNVGIGFIAAASLYYRFTNNMHLMAEPYFRYNFSPLNSGGLSIQEKFTTMGIRIGLRIDF